jgi:predicted nucleotide-binding protein (sugar kinase/HSP70/actin superfamily)
MSTLKSGKYDLNQTALIITQTCGGYRDSNYGAFIRKTLADNGWGHIPVIALSASKVEQHTEFDWTFKIFICF